MFRRAPCRTLSVLLLLAVVACRRAASPDAPSAPPAPNSNDINSDASLFALVTQRQPFSMYLPFPRVDVIRSGSSAHQPVVRVSMNATAFSALQNGTLPRGTRFPNGSIIFKEVLPSTSGAPSVYAVMYRDAGNPLAGDGWVWAEYRPTGSVDYTVTDRGRACTGCHALDDGLSNDLVRTFERQR